MDRSSLINSKVITCIVPKNNALPLVNALRERNILKANINYARRMEAMEHNKLFSGDEVEIVTVIESSETASETFSYIYEFLEIDTKPGSGFIYMANLNNSSPFNLPEIEA